MISDQVVIGTPLVPPSEHRRLLMFSSEYANSGNSSSSLARSCKSSLASRSGLVLDEHGRRRFHGAFTGGFSAGYFNTVGSAEGWTPTQTFSSARNKPGDEGQNSQKHFRKQRPEDFMDDEDDSAHGSSFTTNASYRNSTRAVELDTQNFAGLRTRDSSHNYSIRKSEETSHIPRVVTQDSIGIRILESLGWRLGDAIGSRPSAKNKQLDALVFHMPDHSSFAGIGYNGYTANNVIESTHHRSLETQVTGSSLTEEDDALDPENSFLTQPFEVKALSMRQKLQEQQESEVSRGDIFAGYRASLAPWKKAKVYQCSVSDFSAAKPNSECKDMSFEEQDRVHKIVGSTQSLISRFSVCHQDDSSSPHEDLKVDREQKICQVVSDPGYISTRTIHEWQPERLLCKRFGVKVPESSKYIDDKSAKLSARPSLSKANPRSEMDETAVEIEQATDNLDLETPSKELLQSIFEPIKNNNHCSRTQCAGTKARIMFRPKTGRNIRKTKASSAVTSINQHFDILDDEQERDSELSPAWALPPGRQSKKKKRS